MNNFIKKRIKDNEKIFNKEELLQIEKNYIIIKKIYLIGLSDGQKINIFWLHFDYILYKKHIQNRQKRQVIKKI